MCSIGAKSHILAFTRRMGAWHRQHGDPGTSLQTDHTANRIRSSHGNKKNHLSGARRIRRSPAGLCTLVLRQRGGEFGIGFGIQRHHSRHGSGRLPRRHRRAAGRTRRIDGGARQTGRTHQTRRVGRARRTGGQACQVAQARHAEQSAQARRFEHTSSTGGAHVPTECSLPRADRHAERDDVAGEPGRSVQLERDVGFPPDRRPQPGRQGLLDS